MITSNLELTGIEDDYVQLTSTQFNELTTHVTGSVLLPGEDGWDEAVLLWNGMWKK